MFVSRWARGAAGARKSERGDYRSTEAAGRLGGAEILGDDVERKRSGSRGDLPSLPWVDGTQEP
jgi:hypothetical protein